MQMVMTIHSSGSKEARREETCKAEASGAGTLDKVFQEEYTKRAIQQLYLVFCF